MAPSDFHSTCPGLMEGTFVHVMTEDFAKYLIKVGIDADEAKRYVGSTWSITQRKLEGKRVLFVLVSQEYPEFSGMDTLPEGGDCPTAHPMFGGEAVMKFQMKGDRAYDCQAKSEKYGNFVWTETYSDEGIVFDITAKDKGASVSQLWKRQVNEEGWFKFEKEEGMKEFAKATGIPDEFHSFTSSFKFNIRKNGDVFTNTEFWGPMKNVFSYKLDAEEDYKVEGHPGFDRKMITTRLGPGKFKCIAVPPSGAFKEEWTFTICEDGCLWEGRELKSGVTAKMWTRRYANFEGEYKVLSISGMEDYFALLGYPASVVAKIKSDSSTHKMTVSEREGYVHIVHEAGNGPKRQTVYRYDEEFDFEMPGLSDKFRAINSLKGNDTIVGVFKGPRLNICSTTKFTQNFVIVTATIQGTGVTLKKIYEKIH